MSQQDRQALEAYQWSRQPAAEVFLRGVVQEFVARCPSAATLAQRMHDETGTRFFDWVDSVVLANTPENMAKLKQTGFVVEGGLSTMPVYRHPEGIFPRVALKPGGGGQSGEEAMRVAIKVDSVADFLATNQVEVEIEGQPFAPMRRATVFLKKETQLEVVERRGAWALDPSPPDAIGRVRAAEHAEKFRVRRRAFADDLEGFRQAEHLAEAARHDLGADQACALFFAAEREYWQRRNRVAQVQKARQDRLGLGWGNHDHHTYRSSRSRFKEMITFFEGLGLECRERFYAGREAGWGAQVMENPRAGIVVFADVDLAPEELLEDFAHQPLKQRATLGTVGLWCALHGEAFLQAGMHHLECQFDFQALTRQLQQEHGIEVMKPFTDYPYLRQAFTQGERWKVAEERLKRLLEASLITAEQAEQFRDQGAIGSHLENLERNEGYKGFNQKGVSEIIAATDPRRQVVSTS